MMRTITTLRLFAAVALIAGVKHKDAETPIRRAAAKENTGWKADGKAVF